MWLCQVTAILLLAPPVFADEPEDSDRARSEHFLQLAKRDLRSFELARRDDAEATFLLNPEPVLRWTNPAAGSIYGGLFLWTEKGCPQVAASCFKWYSPYTHTTFEFHSLSEEPVIMWRDGGVKWRTSEPGVEWRPIPNAPVPADTAARRLVQMRALSRGFSADRTDREGLHENMRCLAQPVYRFDSSDPDVVDGGMFVFVRGTDPEILLLIRACRGAAQSRWEFAAARMNSISLRLFHDEHLVWEARTLPWGTVRDRSETYTSFRREIDDGEMR